MHRSEGVTRRRIVASGLAAGAALAAGGAVVGRRPDQEGAPGAASAVDRGRLPRVIRPGRQHEWDAHLGRDVAGNRLPPRHQRLLLCALANEPTPERAWQAEAALRRVERAVPLGHHGLLLTVAWGPSWFGRIGVASPVPVAVALHDAELPRLDDPVCVLHLGSDDERLLERVERALFRGGTLLRAGGSSDRSGPTDLCGLLRVTERRTGFVGAGLPERHRAGVVGLPQDQPLPTGTPMFMGFQSGLKRNQATEDDVTIASGRWAGGTTMHVSSIALALDSWYRSLDDRDRVRRMFAADTTPAKVRRSPRGIDHPADVDVAKVADQQSVVGHAQAAAAARRDGRPVILRRDFDSADGGAARVHFVSLSRSIEDFVATRRAMDARPAVGHGAVGVHVNNGITEWMTVEARANLLVPPRRERICPALPGWSG
ncbi:MAG: Tat pathway signal protein [Patulibacter sp.]|nr:Tat pathway signal protein [Patulibacter sp.]